MWNYSTSAPYGRLAASTALTLYGIGRLVNQVSVGIVKQNEATG